MNQSDSDIFRDASADHEVESAKSFEGAVCAIDFHLPQFHPIPEKMNGKERIYGSVPRS
jgi:hypothetical protein